MPLDYFQYDLTKSSGIAELINGVFNKIDLDKAKKIYLFNNAGMVEPIKPVEKCTSDEIEKAIKVNLIGPMVITSAYLANTENVNCDKKIINIFKEQGNLRDPKFIAQKLI